MTEPGPFTPPGGSGPSATPPVPAPAAPPPTLPPPTGAPIGATPLASAPAPARRKRWLIPVIIGGSLAFVGLIVGVAFAANLLAQSVSQTVSPLPSGDVDELLQGDPGSPVATDPLDCGACFDIEDARTLALPNKAYAEVGLGYGDDDSFELSAGDDQAESSRGWTSDGGEPDRCYFTYTSAPLFFEPGDPDDPAAEGDLVHYGEWHFDSTEYYSFTEAVRVFDESAAAAAHLTALESAIADCGDYSQSETGWYAEVSATPALDLPRDVAAYGWAESAGPNRFYGVDLQRGNLVARLTLFTDPDGPTQGEFRDLVEAYAVLLGELTPAG